MNSTLEWNDQKACKNNFKKEYYKCHEKDSKCFEVQTEIFQLSFMKVETSKLNFKRPLRVPEDCRVG